MCYGKSPISAAFPTRLRVLTGSARRAQVHSEAGLVLARTALEASGVPGAEWAAPQLEIELQLELGEVDGAPTAQLRCSLPPGYPARCAAAVSVSVGGLQRAVQDELTARLRAKAGVLLGDEAVRGSRRAAAGVQRVAGAHFSRASDPFSHSQPKEKPFLSCQDSLSAAARPHVRSWSSCRSCRRPRPPCSRPTPRQARARRQRSPGRRRSRRSSG